MAGQLSLTSTEEKGRRGRKLRLFVLDDTLYLYDLTSTYFEGQAENNPQAKQGYSRDKWPDCKQVLVGLVLDGDGFPKAHEVFEGNRQDRITVKEMLESLEKRTGQKPGSTVVVDRAWRMTKIWNRFKLEDTTTWWPADSREECLVGGIRERRRLGRGDSNPLAAQSGAEKIAGSDQASAERERDLPSLRQ